MTTQIVQPVNPRPLARMAVILFTLLTGCASEPPTVGQPTDLSQVCDRQHDGERVAVEGYLKLPDEISLDDTISVLLEIRRSEDLKDLTNRVGVWTSYGTEPNQVAPVEADSTFSLPGSGNPPQPSTYSNDPSTVGTYTQADLQVITSDGQSITYRDRVRVSGTVVFPSSPTTTAISVCVLNNPLIERLP